MKLCVDCRFHQHSSGGGYGTPAAPWERHECTHPLGVEPVTGRGGEDCGTMRQGPSPANTEDPGVLCGRHGRWFEPMPSLRRAEDHG